MVCIRTNDVLTADGSSNKVFNKKTIYIENNGLYTDEKKRANGGVIQVALFGSWQKQQFSRIDTCW